MTAASESVQRFAGAAADFEHPAPGLQVRAQSSGLESRHQPGDRAGEAMLLMDVILDAIVETRRIFRPGTKVPTETSRATNHRPRADRSGSLGASFLALVKLVATANRTRGLD